MPACIPLIQEKIRAEVWMGSTLLARTPFVTNFSINQSRNQNSTTFSVTFEMIAGTSFPLGAQLIIKAGFKGALKTRLTGIIETTTAQPALGKPTYFSVTLGGRGVLSDLENKKFSRRLKSSGQGLFCLITSDTSADNRPEAYYSLSKKIFSGNHTTTSDTPNPAKRGGSNSPFIVHVSQRSDQSAGGLAKKLAGKPGGGDESRGQGASVVHTHEDLDQGGPSFAVYSAD